MLNGLMKLLGAAGHNLQQNIAGVGRQINPFDRGASFGNANPSNTGNGAPLPPSFFKPSRPVADPLPFSMPRAYNNQVPFITQGGIPFSQPNGQPFTLGPHGSFPVGAFNTANLRAIPYSPQDELSQFPQQSLMKLIGQ